MGDENHDGEEFALDVLFGVKPDDSLHFALMKVLAKLDRCYAYADDSYYGLRAASILKLLEARGIDLSGD